MRVAVIQPSYAPWLGYISMMRHVDLFVYYDNVQYDKNGWRNRNRVLANGHVKWLTLSIDKTSLGSSLHERRLMNVKLASYGQFAEHRRLLEIYYKSEGYISLLETFYPDELNKNIFLADSVVAHTEHIAKLFDIKSDRIRSSMLDIKHSSDSIRLGVKSLEQKNARLLKVLKEVGCTEYVSGEAARAYLNEELFMQHGISVTWNPYKGDGLNLSVLHYALKYGTSYVLRLLSV